MNNRGKIRDIFPNNRNNWQKFFKKKNKNRKMNYRGVILNILNNRHYFSEK